MAKEPRLSRDSAPASARRSTCMASCSLRTALPCYCHTGQPARSLNKALGIVRRVRMAVHRLRTRRPTQVRGSAQPCRLRMAETAAAATVLTCWSVSHPVASVGACEFARWCSGCACELACAFFGRRDDMFRREAFSSPTCPDSISLPDTIIVRAVIDPTTRQSAELAWPCPARAAPFSWRRAARQAMGVCLRSACAMRPRLMPPERGESVRQPPPVAATAAGPPPS